MRKSLQGVYSSTVYKKKYTIVDFWFEIGYVQDMDWIKSSFHNGIKIVAPFLLTLFILYWLFIGLERFLQSFLLLFIEPSSYFTGLGLLFAIVLIFFIGMIARIGIIRRLKRKLVEYFIKLPGVKTFYNTSSDLTNLFTKKGIKGGGVVMLKTPVGKVLGIVTQKQVGELPEGIGGKDEIAVYVQMSYNLGGYTFIVPKESVEPLAISVKDGMALSLTAYVSGNKDKS